MAGLGDLFGEGSTARQLFEWQVIGALISALMDPAQNELSYLSNEAAPIKVLDPATLAVMVNRHIVDHGDAASDAQKSGISGNRFDKLVAAAGEAPAPEALAEALRRKIIPEGGVGADSISFEQGISEGNLRNKWADVIRQLSMINPSPVDMLDALLEGQLSRGEALDKYKILGGNPEYFDILFNSKGQAPTPNEGIELLNRGIIPERGTGPAATSYEQLFLEGPWRDKWLPAFLALREYLPPPRTVTAMLKNGSISEAMAHELLMKQGLSSDLADAYIADAQHQASTGDRELTASQAIALYESKLISKEHALIFLEATGYGKANADYLLALADSRRAIAAVNSAVSRIQTLYIGHKIDKSAARGDLASLGVPAAQISDIMTTWDLERAANVKLLTPAQIAKAVKMSVYTADQGTTELVQLGYSATDAHVFLVIEGALNAPAATAPPATTTGG